MNFSGILNLGKEILIIKPSSLGDIAQAIPLAGILKQSNTEVKISWLVNEEYRELLLMCPWIDRMIIFKRSLWRKKRVISGYKALLGMIRELKWAKYDVVIDLQGLLRTGVFTYLTKAPIRVGFKDARECANLFYTHKVSCLSSFHAHKRYISISRLFGICETEFPKECLKLFPSDIDYAESVWQGVPLRIILAPYTRWESKQWGLVRYKELVKILYKTLERCKVVVIGTGSGNQWDDIEVINLVGKTTLREMVSLISTCSLIVCNDSGPMHIASLLGKDTVAIFGPTNLSLTGPWYGRYEVVINKRIPCRGCRERTCKEHICMQNITVENVMKAIMSLLQQQGKSI